jgi:subtilase family serine protease
MVLCLCAAPSLRAQTVSEIISGGPLVIQHKNLRALNVGINNARAAPTDADCLAIFGVHCYSPQQMRHAYGVDALIDAGFTGAGETIVIIDSFGSPTIEHDLKVFDAAYGLPDPPSFKVLAPLGSVPFVPTSGPAGMIGWAIETTLDVEWAHAMAPGADIILLTSPVAETEGVEGMPEFLALEQYALDHHLGKIISQSWLATENTLFDHAGQQVLRDFERFYQKAREENMTVLAASGDTGATDFDLNFNLFPFQTVGYPASSPLVTAVGGTTLSLDTAGNRLDEVTWGAGIFGATGGGISQQFAEPEFQRQLPRATETLLHGNRGIPDLAYNADPRTAVTVFLTILPGLSLFAPVGGTSAGSPQWAGIVADLNQFAGRPIGFLNDKLYKLGRKGQLAPLFNDITVGDNSLIVPGFIDVPGFSAGTGWDAVTGWGTPKANGFVQAMANGSDED